MSDSLFQRLGGEAAVDAAVNKFYEKVLADPALSPFFANTDMEKQHKMQKAFLTVAFGGPNNYSGRGMREAHKKAVSDGLNETHFDKVVGHLATTLTELGVSDADIQEVAAVAGTVKDDVLNR